MTRVLILLALAGLSTGIAAQEIGPAPVRAAAELTAPDLVAPKGSLAAQRWRHASLTAAELELLHDRNTLAKMLHVGVSRDLPRGIHGGVPLDGLAWVTQPDGSRVAAVEFESPGAAALRVSLDARAWPDGLTVRTYAAEQAGHLHGAVDAVALAGGPAEAWLPEQPGDVVGLELHAAAGADLRGLRLPVMQLMHLVVTPHAWNEKRLRDIGEAGACNIDVACADGNWFATGAAVAKYIVATGRDEQGRRTAALCTGTLVNNHDQDGAPLFMTARHCISDQERASSLTLYWHFERAECGGADPGSVIQTTGGARLLATADDHDMVLTELNNAPPASAMLAGWNANRPQRHAEVVGLHHPHGDLKKYSLGSVDAFTSFGGGQHFADGPYRRVRWSAGTTESGSSGSALFNDDEQVVGTLRGGVASCERPDDPDYYGRLDLAYPKFAEWLGGSEQLDPDVSPEPEPEPEPEPDPPSQPGNGGGGGHGGLLLALLPAWLARTRGFAWTTPSGFCGMPNGRRWSRMPS